MFLPSGLPYKSFRLYVTQHLQFEIWILRLSLRNCFMKFTSTKENSPLLFQKEKRRSQNGGKRTAESAKPQTTRGCKGYDIAHKVITVSNWVSVNQRYFVSYPGLLIVSGGWKPFCRQQTQLSVKWIPPCWQALNKQLHHTLFFLFLFSAHDILATNYPSCVAEIKSLISSWTFVLHITTA